MNILFKFLNPITSKDYNERFADLAGGSLFAGFYFEQATAPLRVNVVKGNDPSSLLIFKSGIRVESERPLDNAFKFASNTTQNNRKDWVYVHYEHSSRETNIDFVIISGNNEPVVDTDSHLLIGTIIVPPGASALGQCTVEYTDRGWRMRDVVNEVSFKKPIRVSDATEDEHAINKRGAQQLISDYDEVNYLNRFSSDEDNKGIFRITEFKRANGTIHTKSTLSNPDAFGSYQLCHVETFEDDGTTLKDLKIWHFEYNEMGQLRDKVLVD